MTRHWLARRPEDLSRFFIERANAGDAEGVVRLYDPDALLAEADGQVVRGAAAIEQFYRRLLASRPTFARGEQQPSLVFADLALTSTKLVGGGATAEIARQQADGSWLWVVDQPNL